MSDPETKYPAILGQRTTKEPPNYTGSPWQLFFQDLGLFFHNFMYLPNLFLPLFPWPSGRLDELYPSTRNLLDIGLHCILFILQLLFLLSLPLLVIIPFWVFVLYVGAAVAINTLICRLLNGGIPEDGLKSTEDEYSRTWPAHDDEYWIFLNGICVGKNWLQSNVDRLSRTFHRPVVGVHNKTSGVIFDIIQCLIQRALCLATSDVRECYALVKKALYKRGVKKVIFILHSQGGIEGGLILDWLLDEVPHDLLQYLEVYTFACIANHFNDPSLLPTAGASNPNQTRSRAISHIEHYANTDDFASRFGVLHFTRETPAHSLQNRFMGTVFANSRSGHQLNQHYLDPMFPLDSQGKSARDPVPGDFMNMRVSTRNNPHSMGHGIVLGPTVPGITARETEVLDDHPTTPPDIEYPDATGRVNMKAPKVCNLSRLWQYRNGRCPASSSNRIFNCRDLARKLY